MDASLVTTLLLGVGAGLAAELLLEFALPGLAHRVRQVWWIPALSRAPAHRLLGPVWLLALAAVWWSLRTGLASGGAGLVFVAVPSLATVVTAWRLGQPSGWRRPGGVSG